MELHEKLQTLRKQKGLTQEELAAELFVSRTAISKWESGRGYPSIDSLKAISGFFSITIDELLSGEELLTVAQTEQRRTQTQFRDQIFGTLDCAAGLLFFLPFFGQSGADGIRAVSLFSLTEISAYLKAAYGILTAATTLWGICLLALQGRDSLLPRQKMSISLCASLGAILLFTLSRQPYAAVFALVLLGGKVLFLLKNR